MTEVVEVEYEVVEGVDDKVDVALLDMLDSEVLEAATDELVDREEVVAVWEVVREDELVDAVVELVAVAR